MCKTEIRLELLCPLDDCLRECLARAHSIYGFFRVWPEPGDQALRVVYDATRLSDDEVVSRLRRLGIPVKLGCPGAVPNRA